MSQIIINPYVLYPGTAAPVSPEPDTTLLLISGAPLEQPVQSPEIILDEAQFLVPLTLVGTARREASPSPTIFSPEVVRVVGGTSGNSGYLQAEDKTNFNFDDVWTLEFFFWPIDYATGDQYKIIASLTGTDGWYVRLDSSTAPDIAFLLNSTGSPVAGTSAAPSPSVKVGEWNHLYIQRQGNAGRVGLNGTTIINDSTMFSGISYQNSPVQSALNIGGTETSIASDHDNINAYFTEIRLSNEILYQGESTYTVPTAPFSRGIEPSPSIFGAGLWTPELIGADLHGWWDVSDASVVVHESPQGSPARIIMLLDKAGRLDVPEGSGGAGPMLTELNGLPCAYFDTSAYMTVDASTGYSPLLHDSSKSPAGDFSVFAAFAKKFGGSPATAFPTVVQMSGADAWTSGWHMIGTTSGNQLTVSVNTYSANAINLIGSPSEGITDEFSIGAMLWDESADQLEGFLNGTSKGTASDTGTVAHNSVLTLGGARPGGSNGLNGYLGEVLYFDRLLTTKERQLVEGYLAHKWRCEGALDDAHPYRFFPPTTASPRDLYWANVELLCQFEGADAATSDTSEDHGARSLSFSLNAQLDTAQKRFGQSSLLLDGNADRVEVPLSSDFDLTTEDFTIEGWMRFNSLPSSSSFLGMTLASHYENTSNDRSWLIAWTTTNQIQVIWSYNGSSIAGNVTTTDADSPIAVDTWYHVAVSRYGSELLVFLNGRKLAYAGSPQQFTSSIHSSVSHPLWIGGVNTSVGFQRWMDGWIDGFRMTVGVARYLEDFDVPTEPWPET